MQNEGAFYFQCGTSLEVPGKNFEFVAVKEEIIDEFLADEHCLHLEHGDKLG
jgi:hypothetical protein